jgi:hypothetical protein
MYAAVPGAADTERMGTLIAKAVNGLPAIRAALAAEPPALDVDVLWSGLAGIGVMDNGTWVAFTEADAQSIAEAYAAAYARRTREAPLPPVDWIRDMPNRWVSADDPDLPEHVRAALQRIAYGRGGLGDPSETPEERIARGWRIHNARVHHTARPFRCTCTMPAGMMQSSADVT